MGCALVIPERVRPTEGLVALVARDRSHPVCGSPFHVPRPLVLAPEPLPAGIAFVLRTEVQRLLSSCPGRWRCGLRVGLPLGRRLYSLGIDPVRRSLPAIGPS